MRITALSCFRSNFFTMALHPAETPTKLIFAPEDSQYTKGSLSGSQLDASPLLQFHSWFAHAQASGVPQPETTCLSTASQPSGRISSRYVYLKELDARGFVIYSNWATSRKAQDIASNPYAALAFWWPQLERQVRVEGRIERLSPAESQVYFDTRIRGSRVGAWASRQSRVLESREQLQGWVDEAEKRFEGQEQIPVPEFWGGIRIIPDRMEFWQGRESRLHDRFEYVKEEGGEEWKIQRLSP